jgi:hypothetical protein
MAAGANIDDLIQEATEVVPAELQENLRAWLSRARAGDLAGLCQELMAEADTAWQTFDLAANKVLTKLKE